MISCSHWGMFPAEVGNTAKLPNGGYAIRMNGYWSNEIPPNHGNAVWQRLSFGPELT